MYFWTVGVLLRDSYKYVSVSCKIDKCDSGLEIVSNAGTELWIIHGPAFQIEYGIVALCKIISRLPTLNNKEKSHIWNMVLWEKQNTDDEEK